MRSLLGVIGFGVTVALAPVANAVPVSYDFTCNTGNKPADCTIGEAQMKLVVSSQTGGVLFTFSNVGLEASSLTRVFLDTSLSLALSISSTPGVSFSVDTSPANFPGKNNVSPSFSTDYSASADSQGGVAYNGVNPNESLGILLGGSLFGDVIAALDSGVLRVGIKVQAFEGGGSETFVNTPPVPEPRAAILFLVGTALAAHSIRRR